jgi:hypothetical protein
MMNGIETRKVEMLARVREFGANHSASFAPTSVTTTLLAQVGAAVDILAAHSAAQIGSQRSTRQATANRNLTRQALRDDLEAISLAARVIAKRMPSLDEKLRMPGSLRDQALLGTARAFLADATPLEAEFVRHELPADFLAKLAADIAAFEQALSEQRRAREDHKTASTSIGETLDGAVEAVRELDALLRNKFRNDAVTLSAWTQASRIRWRAGRGKASAAEHAGEPASSPA